MTWQAEGLGLTHPTHTYSHAGLYVVTLLVTHPGTLETAVTETYASIIENLVADVNGPYTGTINVPVTFDARATSGKPHSETWFDWNFGDTSSNPLCNIYAADGVTTISQIDFGDMVINQPAGTYVRTFIIENNGDTILNISMSCQGNPLHCGMINLSPTTFTLNPTEQQIVSVDFVPTLLGALSGTISLGDICSDLLILGSGTNTQNSPICNIQGYPGSGDITIPLYNVEINHEEFASIVIANAGGGTLTGIVVKQSGNDEINIATAPATYSLEGGQTKEFLFRYAPTSVGSHTALFNLGASCSRNLIINGTSTGVGPPKCWMQSGNTISFGNITIGSTASRTISIVSQGGSALVGTLTPACSTSSGMTLEGSRNTPIDFTIQPRSSESYTVSFTPTTTGTRSCTITVTDNAPANDACGDIEVTGKGVEGGSGNDPPYCVSGNTITTEWPHIYSDGFWGWKDDSQNRHGNARGRHPASGDKFTTISNNEGRMRHNSSLAYYFGEEYLEQGTIHIEFMIETDPTIPDHPINGAHIRNWQLMFPQSCCQCRDAGSYSGGANTGGHHYWGLMNGHARIVDPNWTRFDFNSPSFGSINVTTFNKQQDHPGVLSQPEHRFSVPAIQPDQWASIDITWQMWSTVSENKYDRCDLTVAGSTHTFNLLPGSCGCGRILAIGLVERRRWNQAGTAILHTTNCTQNSRCPTTNPECSTSSSHAPFPGVHFRSIRLPAAV